MADALAVTNWRANLDGRDLEFVLGRAPTVVRNRLEPTDFSDDQPLQGVYLEARYKPGQSHEADYPSMGSRFQSMPEDKQERSWG